MNDETVGIHGAGAAQAATGGGGPQFQTGPGPAPQPSQAPQPGPAPMPHFQGGQQQYGPPTQQPAQHSMQMHRQFAPQGYPAEPSAWPMPRIAALVVVLAGLGTLIASLFSLYSATVTPSSWDFTTSDAPSGSVSVGLGFYDTVPIAAPMIAVAIPMFMLIAGLTALPLVFRGQNQKPVLPAFFTLAAALVAIVLMIAGPMPGITVTGEMGRELQSEVGTADLNKLIDTVVPISPGVGLILALVFAIIGAAAALYVYIDAERAQRRGRGAGQPGPGYPASTQPGMAQTGMAQPAHPLPQQFAGPSWQQPQHGGQHQGQNW